jgi:hypothetical protein
MPRRQNALLSGAFHLERSLSELLEQNPDVLEPAEAKRLRSAINSVTKLLPCLRQLAQARQAAINAEELRGAEQKL